MYEHATMQLSAINTVCSSIVRPLVYNGHMPENVVQSFFFYSKYVNACFRFENKVFLAKRNIKTYGRFVFIT